MSRNRREVLRDAYPMQDRIAALLQDRPRTVPELAESLEAPSDEVFIWLAAMLRYGAVEPVGRANSEGYFTYALKEAH
ncbi:MAG TPA: hypothetical protein VMI31_09810 [Fimbriimonadaceae bacterium]|nr:hypothetical protein [Fimbriimonadaceae bacterium]